ncbi:MAG TPA: DUF58 domain-containing protein [Thermoplasmata archaeon]
MSDPAPPRGPLWRPAALLMFAVSALLVLVGIVVRSPVPLLAAVPLLLAPVAAALAAPRGELEAELTWSSDGSGAEVRVAGTVRPRTDGVAQGVELRLFRPSPLTETEPPTVTVDGGRVRFESVWHAPYPFLATLARPEAVWSDPIGLVEIPLHLDGSALRLERFPPEVTRIGSVRLHRTTPQPGEIRSRQVGSSGEFFSVRAAAPTDTPRQINWRASARTGRLVSNDFYLERTGDLLLLLDLRPSSLGADRDEQLLSVSRAAALGIATGFLADKSRVGLGLFDEFLAAVPMGTGRLQRFRIAQALQRARLAENPGPSERLAVSLRRYFPPGVTTVLLSPLADEESLILLTHLRRRGYPTIVLSPSPIPLLAPPLGVESADDSAALRLLRLVRRQRIGEAWREGPVVEWEDYWSLSPFVRFLSVPVTGRGGRR